MSELKEYLCIEAKTIEYKDSHGYRFTFATKSAPEACMESVYLKSEADKVIEELKADYNEACDRLQTANLIKDEQLAATRHSNHKRCVAMARWCEDEAQKCLMEQSALICFPNTDRFQYLQVHFLHFSRWHRRWMKLAKKFKDSEH